MENNILSQRQTSPAEKNEIRRKYIVDNYQEYIPDIDNFINERKRGYYDYSMYAKEFKKKILQDKFNSLSAIVVDIRNNTSPTTYYSNSINKTDNRYSNETKKLVKHLLAKGWSNNEIAYEMEKIYGSGIVSYHSGLVDDTPITHKMVYYAFNILGYCMLYKIGKIVFLGRNSKGFINKYVKLIKKK